MKEVIEFEHKKAFFDRLDEHRKREYAALEAQSLSYGGQSAVQRAFGISRSTIRKGIGEIGHDREVSEDRIRKKGGAEKKLLKILQRARS